MTLALLRDAAADQHGVWIGYADGEGRATRMLFYPQRIDGGRAVGIVDGSTIDAPSRSTGLPVPPRPEWLRPGGRPAPPAGQPRRVRLKPTWLAWNPSAS